MSGRRSSQETISSTFAKRLKSRTNYAFRYRWKTNRTVPKPLSISEPTPRRLVPTYVIVFFCWNVRLKQHFENYVQNYSLTNRSVSILEHLLESRSIDLTKKENTRSWKLIWEKRDNKLIYSLIGTKLNGIANWVNLTMTEASCCSQSQARFLKCFWLFAVKQAICIQNRDQHSAVQCIPFGKF